VLLVLCAVGVVIWFMQVKGIAPSLNSMTRREREVAERAARSSFWRVEVSASEVCDFADSIQTEHRRDVFLFIARDGKRGTIARDSKRDGELINGRAYEAPLGNEPILFDPARYPRDVQRYTILLDIRNALAEWED
jgi:hypothetical protein